MLRDYLHHLARFPAAAKLFLAGEFLAGVGQGTIWVLRNLYMKRQIMGREVVVAVTEGKLDLGPWEQIFYGEFDGGRRKRALIKIIGE